MRIIFTDGIGTAVLHNGKPGAPSRATSWNPNPLPAGDKANRQSDGALTVFRYRDDFGASFDLTQIPVASQKTNLIEVNGDIVGVGGTPAGFTAAVAPNVMTGILAGAPGGYGYNGIIAKHTRDTGTADTNVGEISVNVVNTHHLVAGAWVYIPSTTTLTALVLDWQAGGATITSIVTGAADLTKRDQWQLVTATATATATGTTFPTLRLTGPTGALVYSDLWSYSDLDDGLFTRMVDVADRLAYWLANGGTCEVDTGDYEANIYTTCGLYPGTAQQQPTLSDKKNLEYTLHLNLVNLAASPARMRCHYVA